ncbi:MAG: molybdopterin cofactor-binding domain-containing protein, partial [Clostridiales bacterium]
GYGYYDQDGRVTIHSKSVGVYCHADMIAEGLGLETNQLRIIQNNAGGTFGYKLSPTLEAILAVAVMNTGRPCYLEFTMHQQLTYTGKRSPFFTKIKMGCDDRGKLTAMESEVLADHGAYSEFADLLLIKNVEFTAAGYQLPSIRGQYAISFTNHAYGAAMRAYGSPQAFFVGESIVDELARSYGMDPFDFRYQNLYNEESTTPTGCKPDVLVLQGLLDQLRPAYQEARKTIAAFPAGKIKRGVGVAIGIYSSGDDGYDHSEAAVELQPDGKIALYSTWEDHGQGGDMGALTSVHEAFYQLGMPKSIDDFIFVTNDTARCPNSGYAAGSRSQLMVGNAIWD